MLQFRQLFTLLILLLNCHLNSSSSILKMERLTLEESSIHTTGGNVTNFSKLTGTLLTGYTSWTRYTDATCSVVRYSESYPLNECFPWISGNSYKSLFNGTHIFETEYSDYSCTKQIDSYLIYSPPRVCDNDFMSTAITASYPTIASTKTLLSAT